MKKKVPQVIQKIVSVGHCYCATFCDILKCQNKNTNTLFSTLMDSPVKDVSVQFMSAKQR